jgi:WD40 repeat protein
VQAIVADSAHNQFFTSAADGVIRGWDVGVGGNKSFIGVGHTNTVPELALKADGTLVSCSMDESVRFTATTSRVYGDAGLVSGLKSPVTGIAVGATYTVAATINNVFLIKGGAVVDTVAQAAKANCAAISVDETEVLVGGEGKAIQVFKIANNKLVAGDVLDYHRGAVTCIRYSHSGKHFASGDGNRELVIWDSKTKKRVIENEQFHSARITCMDWSPSDVHIATGGVDQQVIVSDVTRINDNKFGHVIMKNCNIGGVNAVAFIDENTVLSTGLDGHVRQWSISYEQAF